MDQKTQYSFAERSRIVCRAVWGGSKHPLVEVAVIGLSNGELPYETSVRYAGRVLRKGTVGQAFDLLSGDYDLENKAAEILFYKVLKEGTVKQAVSIFEKYPNLDTSFYLAKEFAKKIVKDGTVEGAVQVFLTGIRNGRRLEKDAQLILARRISDEGSLEQVIEILGSYEYRKKAVLPGLIFGNIDETALRVLTEKHGRVVRVTVSGVEEVECLHFIRKDGGGFQLPNDLRVV